MPRIISERPSEENCPECSSRLINLCEIWDSFPGEDSPIFVVFDRCNICGYELVTQDETDGRLVPYERHRKDTGYIDRLNPKSKVLV